MKEASLNKDYGLAVQCYNHIQEAIVSGTFIPGQKLKVEELKQQLGVGQSPIREALSRLAASGLVEAQDNKGFRVAQISEFDIRDTYKTFFHIEMLALEQAMKLGDDAWESSIVAALYNLSLVETNQDGVSYQVWIERNYDFHSALIAGCKSPLLQQVRAHVYQRIDRYYRIVDRIAFDFLPAELAINHEEHKKIAAAVISRDSQEVAALMRHHIFGGLEEVIEVLKQHNLL